MGNSSSFIMFCLGAAGLIWTNCNCSQGSTRIGLLLWLVVLRSDEHVLWTLIQNTRIVGLWYRQVSGIAEVPTCIPSIWETSENYREYTVNLRTCFIDCYKTVNWGCSTWYIMKHVSHGVYSTFGNLCCIIVSWKTSSCQSSKISNWFEMPKEVSVFFTCACSIFRARCM